MHRILPLALALIASVSGSAVADTQPAVPAPAFDPMTFFTGHTEGIGRMRIILRAGQELRVHGTGQLLPDGAIQLDQVVEQAGKPDDRRHWLIRATAPGHYGGTLSDARGDFAGEDVAGRLHLSFTSKSGYRVEQWLTLSPDGRTAANRLVARKMGMVVATMDETIRKVD